MKRFLSAMALPLFMAASAVSHADEVVIDFFDTVGPGPFVVTTDTNLTTANGTDGPLSTILGEYRDVSVTCIAGCVPTAASSTAFVYDGVFNFSNDTNVEGQAVIAWDGAGVGGAAVGLGGVDLTIGGAIDTLSIDVESSDGGGPNQWFFQIYVETSADVWSLVTLEAAPVVEPGQVFYLPFALWGNCAAVNVECGVGGAADLTSVNKINLVLNVFNEGGLLDDLDLRVKGISAAVPEPEVLSIMGLGLLMMGLAGGRRKRLKK